MLRIKVADNPGWYHSHGPGAMTDCHTALYDLTSDPGQTRPIEDAGLESQLVDVMRRLMQASQAPDEAFERLAIHPGQGT